MTRGCGISGWRRRTRLLRHVAQLASELEEAKRLEDEEREVLIVRHKERRVLERLAEKQRQVYEVERGRRGNKPFWMRPRPVGSAVLGQVM